MTQHPTPSSCPYDGDKQMESLNNIPTPSQQLAPGQKEALSLDREQSSIPMGGKYDGQVWIYPSEQMFFNAMKRKQWNPNEKDMHTVVPIHNAVNEQAWKQILEWESLHKEKCNQPKLLQFRGRPKDVTPKAWIRNFLFGHDWTIDRCGETVTYVIDFYSGAPDPERPEKISFFLDVRPALSWTGLKDKFYKFLSTGSGLW